MFGRVARFEFAYQVKSPAYIVIFSMFFLLTYGAVSTEQITIGGGGNTNINSPFAISQTGFIMSLFGLFIPTALLSNTILRDSSHKMDGVLFSTPINKFDYLIGRFTGGFLAVLLAFTSVPIGMFVGSLMPWIDPETLGPNRLHHYLYMLFVIGMPNLLITGMIMYTVANVTRSTLMTYLALVTFLVGYAASQAALQDPDLRTFAALADPFGFGGWSIETRNWTSFERNELLAPVRGLFLQNRLLWMGISIGLLILNYFIFSFRSPGKSGRKKKTLAMPQSRFIPTEINLPTVTRDFSAKTQRKQFWARTGFEMRSVFMSVTFWILLILGVFNTVSALIFPNEVFGTPTLPVTRDIILQVVGAFGIVPVIVIAFYAGDLVWRDRGVKLHEIIDSTPTPSWAFFFPKLLAVSLVLLLLMVVASITGMVMQLVRGYTNLEPAQYAMRLLYLFGWPLILTAVLAFFLQVLFNNKYLGYLGLLIYFIGSIIFAQIGFEHNLYNFASSPIVPYSDLNGYGHFLTNNSWFNAYWTTVSIVLIVLTYLLWNRGALTSIFKRLVYLPSSIRGITGPVLAISVIASLGLGGWIYYNTNIVNEYRTTKDNEKIAVAYEEKYKPLVDALQPKIVDVNVDVAIYPKTRQVKTNGVFILENKTAEPINRIHLEYSSGLKVLTQEIEGAVVDNENSDAKQNIYFFDLSDAMQPGERLQLQFETEISSRGFKNSNGGTDFTVVGNGTFINNSDVFPSVGYQEARILRDRNTRRRYGLEPVERVAKLEDVASHNRNYLTADSDYVNFEATVSTDGEQIAIAPGYLEREWSENNRRYFHYKMDVPILNFFSFQSADYTVKEGQWNDVDIQIFYHKPHDFNVDRMVEATQASLEYFSKNFSPYQYRQLRIIEFPYRSFAQAFPNTVPFSENIGFILDTSDPERVDSAFFVTSHEVAHQWWAHQVMGAAVQGGTMLVETFAQYSAFMAIEKEFGSEHVRDFLKLELDRYLSARGGERLEELPLYRVENQQYIHYSKGALSMYALKDYVGEEVVNRSLARLIDLRAYQSRPYATTLDFLKILKEEAGPEHDGLIADLFEKITIFDLEAEDAKIEERDDGKFDVTLTYKAKKFYADGEGRETEADIYIPIDIGVFLKSPADGKFSKDDVLYLAKHKIDPSNPVITITVDQKPGYAGIDPYVKLVDRDADNNVKRIN